MAGAMLALLGGAAAQVYVPANTPGTGAVNYVPLGAIGPAGGFQNLRAQVRVPAAFLPSTGATITEIGFAGASTGSYRYTSLEVRLAHLKGPTLVQTFEQNLAGAVVMRSAANAQLALTKDQWSPLGATASFVHDGSRDLVLDVVIQGAVFFGTAAGCRTNPALQTLFATDYFTSNPWTTGDGPFGFGPLLALTLNGGTIVVVGQGCPKADTRPVTIGWSGNGQIGTKLTVRAAAAEPSTTLALLLGTNEQKFGALVLPFDLAPIGAAGCLLRTDVVVTPSVAADPTGAGAFDLAIPNDPSLKGAQVLAQWLAPGKNSNALGFVLSALLKTGLH